MSGGVEHTAGREALQEWARGGESGGGQGAAFDQEVSNVLADSFRGKLQALAPLVPKMPSFWYRQRCSSNTQPDIVLHALDSGDTSPPSPTLRASSRLCSLECHGRLFWRNPEGSVAKPRLSLIAVSVLVLGSFARAALINLLASLCFELAQGCSADKLFCETSNSAERLGWSFVLQTQSAHMRYLWTWLLFFQGRRWKPLFSRKVQSTFSHTCKMTESAVASWQCCFVKNVCVRSFPKSYIWA